MQHDSDYMDIPPHYVNVENYRATLAHKINHSFNPNCGWDTIQHPVFGKIPSVVALADIERGSIYSVFLSCYDLPFPPQNDLDFFIVILMSHTHTQTTDSIWPGNNSEN